MLTPEVVRYLPMQTGVQSIGIKLGPLTVVVESDAEPFAHNSEPGKTRAARLDKAVEVVARCIEVALSRLDEATLRNLEQLCKGKETP